MSMNPTHALFREEGELVAYVAAEDFREGHVLVELPSDFWEDERARYSWNGSAFVADWAEIDTELHDQVDRGAEAFRNTFVTKGSAQMAVYQAKEVEARSYAALAGAEADPASFPYLAAEAVATASTMADVAALVLGKADEWITLSVAIEAKRLGLKKAITDADTLSEKRDLAGFVWASLLAPPAEPEEPSAD